MWNLTVASGGIWIKTVLVGGAISLALLFTGLIGAEIRTAFEFKKRGYRGTRVRSAIQTSIIGLFVLACIGVALYGFGFSSFIIPYFTGVTVVIGLGWFGFHIIHEELEGFIPED